MWETKAFVIKVKGCDEEGKEMIKKKQLIIQRREDGWQIEN